jgi:hypothetical protein
MVKVEFHGPDGDVETLWATPVAEHQYRVENCPFWAYGVSWLDIVEARRVYEDGFPEFVRVVQKSGHRTIRVILDPGYDASPASKAVLDAVVTLGCTWEAMNTRYVCVDLPPEVELQEVADRLTQMDVQWEHADPTYKDLYGED